MILASLEICIVLSVSENYLTLITRFALHMAGTPRHQDCGLTESLKAQNISHAVQNKTKQHRTNIVGASRSLSVRLRGQQ